MNFSNSSKFKQKAPNFSLYKHFIKIQSLKDLRFFKCILNPIPYIREFISANVQKMLLFCELSQFKSIAFISEKPYITENGKLVYLYSNKNVSKGIFIEEEPSNFGPKMIIVLKTIYNTVYSQEQNPPQDFKLFANYIIDHENQLNQNMISCSQLQTSLLGFDFILKNSLHSRINKSVILPLLNNVFQVKNDYSQKSYEALKVSKSISLGIQKVRAIAFQCLQSFLTLCTKDGIFIFPAKKTLDSRSKNQVTQTDEHLVLNIITKQTRKQAFIQKIETINCVNKKSSIQFTQITYSLVRKNQNNQQCILIKLQTDFFICGTTFLFFQEFFKSVLQKYTDLYLQKPFQSSFQQNLNKTNPGFRKKQLKLDFIHKLFINPKQNIISGFIKAMDLMVIIYLVFEEFMSHLKEQNYLQNIMNPSLSKKRELIQRQLATDLYNSIKLYLQKFTDFKRKYFYFNENF